MRLPVPATADCYTCHGTNTAVEHTFVQFYPTLLEVAKQKGTRSAAVDETVALVEALRAAGVTASDRIFFAFSFGPFIGFWLAFESAARLGCLCLPGGGLSSEARLRLIIENQATVLCCTPSYALRLAEVAADDPQRDGPAGVGVQPGAGRDRVEESEPERGLHLGRPEVGLDPLDDRGEARELALRVEPEELVGERREIGRAHV